MSADRSSPIASERWERPQSPHRPWPPPTGSWVMFQRWHDLLFAHWRVPANTLRPLVPDALPLDLFDGEAWLAVAPFRMSGVRLRGLPPVPGASRFPELNVRTYVRVGEKPGVYFFSLDATNPLAVAAARTGFRLPYHRSRMTCEPFGSGISYLCERGPHGREAAFEAWYEPHGAPYTAVPGTLEHFLVERYCLYTSAGARVWRVEIDHAPWPLQRARAEVRRNTMAAAAGVFLSGDPLLHFARRLDVRVWMPARVR